MKLRHYWNGVKEKCDCGCTERVFIYNWYCVDKLDDLLKKQGYKIVKLKDWELNMVEK